MDIDKRKLGMILKKQRMKKRLTLRELGEKAGVTREAIRLYEAGCMLPEQKKLELILKTLDLKPDILAKVSFENVRYRIFTEDLLRGKAFKYASNAQMKNTLGSELLYEALNGFVGMVFEDD